MDGKTKTFHASSSRMCFWKYSVSCPKKNSKDSYDVIGDKTDGALLWAKSQVSDLEGLKDGGKITDEFVFDPEQKTITTVWEEHGESMFS